MPHILFKPIKDQVVIWFGNTNRYIVVQKEVSDIIQDLHNNIPERETALKLSKVLNVPFDVMASFVSDVKTDVYYANLEKEKTETKSYPVSKVFSIGDGFISKFYSINGLTLQVDYQSDYELGLTHHKFAHLETNKPNTVSTHFKVFTHQKLLYLMVDKDIVGAWDERNIHFFQGKFSMEIIQQLYQKDETKWMGVFHASAVAKKGSCALILGDSGNGKSTALALLQAHGFDCLADDFVPIDSQNNLVHTFPAAISIKKNSVDTLLPYYPELNSLTEIEFKKQHKTVKYLPPKSLNYSAQSPCRALIFVKYTPDETCKLTDVSNIDAFQKIVTDSWLSPLRQNVKSFLNWFEGMPCYQLAYSDNGEMITTFEDLFQK